MVAQMPIRIQLSAPCTGATLPHPGIDRGKYRYRNHVPNGLPHYA
jgi:hypothetical protein